MTRISHASQENAAKSLIPNHPRYTHGLGSERKTNFKKKWEATISAGMVQFITAIISSG